MRMTMTAVTLVVLGATVAGAQTQPPQDRINTALARARQVGIPVTLLEAKIAEGKAKGVSLERIAAAIERREVTLEHANQVMKAQPGADAELSVAADAIESGVSDTVLKTVASSSPKDRRAVAIAALTQLVQLGHGSTEALAKVQEALKRGPEALLNLPAESSGRGRGQGNDGPQGVANGNANGAGGNAGGNSGGNGGGNGGENGGGNGAGKSPTTPPPNVPAPGQSTQPTKPGKDGGNQGRGNGTPAGGRGQN
jgi:hypothetical protein